MFQRRKHSYKKSMDIREQSALKLPEIGTKITATDQSCVSVQSANTLEIQNQNEDKKYLPKRNFNSMKMQR